MPSLLKSARSAPVVLQRVQLDARDRARRLVAEAEEDARRIRAEAGADAHEVRRAAAAAGREEGLAQAGAALAAAATFRGQRLAAIEQELADVALRVAEKIVGRALELEPALVVSLAGAALAPVRARREVFLRVCPEDASLVGAEQPRLAALLERAPGLVLREDATLGRGAVVVETEAGRVDARVETQLALLEQAVRRAEGRP